MQGVRYGKNCLSYECTSSVRNSVLEWAVVNPTSFCALSLRRNLVCKCDLKNGSDNNLPQAIGGRSSHFK